MSAVKETILLVEDEERTRSLLCKLLEDQGYLVLEADDGEAALSISEVFEGEIHLLVTDLMMPIMNGKELADRLCALRPEIKVLFISGISRTDILPEVCEERSDWLHKPFTIAELNSKVRRILNSVREE